MMVNSALVLAIALAITVNLFFAAGGTRGDPRPRPLVLGTLLGWLTLAISSTWGALGRGGAMEGRPGRQLALLAGAIPTAASLWMGAWVARYYAVVASLPVGDNPRCFLLALGLSLPAFLGLALGTPGLRGEASWGHRSGPGRGRRRLGRNVSRCPLPLARPGAPRARVTFCPSRSWSWSGPL